MITGAVLEIVPRWLTIDRSDVHFRAQRGLWGTKATLKKQRPMLEASMDMTGLVTVHDAAKRLGVKDVTMRTYVARYGLTRQYRRLSRTTRSTLVLIDSEVSRLQVILSARKIQGAV